MIDCDCLPSKHLANLRAQMATFAHGGKFFSDGEINALVRRLTMLVALTEEVEEEARLHPTPAKLTRSGAHIEGNVVSLMSRLRSVPLSDGGDIA